MVEALPATCPHGHQLEARDTEGDGYMCDVCHSMFARGTVMMACHKCEFDICDKCLCKSTDARAETAESADAMSSCPSSPVRCFAIGTPPDGEAAGSTSLSPNRPAVAAPLASPLPQRSTSSSPLKCKRFFLPFSLGRRCPPATTGAASLPAPASRGREGAPPLIPQDHRRVPTLAGLPVSTTH